MVTKRELYLNMRDRGMTANGAKLELAGDILLYKAGEMNSTGRERGFYTEWQEKERQQRQRNISLDSCDSKRLPDCDYIQDLAVYQLRELVILGKKWGTVEQSDYLELMAVGNNFSEIAEICGVKWWRVRDEIRRVARVIARNEPWFGLAEILAKACGVSIGRARDIVKRVQ